MARGFACWISFKSVDAEKRFQSWVVKGNAKSEGMGTSSLGLTAHVFKVGPARYLFWWEHVFVIDMAWLLRVALWFVFKKVRRDVVIKRVGKLEVVELLMKQGGGLVGE